MSNTTARGFKIYDEFPDRYGSVIRVQESSLATEPAVWIFHENSDLTAMPHLTREHATRLRDALDEFLRDTTC